MMTPLKKTLQNQKEPFTEETVKGPVNFIFTYTNF